MSAESEMAAILSHASSNASSLASSAQSLVNTAVAVISNPIELPLAPVVIQARGLTNFDALNFDPVDRGTGKPGLPKFPDLEIPPLPSLITVEDIDAEFEAELDALTFPTFQYPSPGNVPRFSTAVPSLNSIITLPPPPDSTLPPLPGLSQLARLPSVQMTVLPSDFAQPGSVTGISSAGDFFDQPSNRFFDAIFGGHSGIRGLDELLSELSAMSNQAFGSLFTDFIDLIGQKLTDRYQNGLASRVESSIQQGLNTAIQEETGRIRTAMQDRSGWDLPALVQQALSANMEQSISAWAAQAQSQQATDNWEQAQSVFELSATLYEKLRRAIQELKTREVEMVLEAHQQAIRYAKQVTDALLTAFTVKNYQRYDLEFNAAESELRLFEEQLKVQLIEYEIVFAQLEAEKAEQEQDNLLVQQHQTKLQNLEVENRLLATQVDAARAELELKVLPVEIFEAEIQAFAARVNAYEAQVSALVAEISGNTALIEAESTKIKGFEAQADAFIAQVNAARAVIQAQKQRNDSVLEELKAKVKAAMAPVEVSTSQAKYQLATYEASAKDFLADAKAALEKARLDEEWRQQEQKGLFDAYQMTREQALSIAGKKLQTLKAVAEVNNEGAQIMAQMAEGAISAANGITNVIFEESA